MNVAIIQARTNSTRLPGKMMFPLDGEPVVRHVVRRTAAAESIDEVVVATTTAERDDVLEREARAAGAAVYRGSEEDVLARTHNAASEHDPDVVVRVAGDRVLLPVDCLEAVIETLVTREADYVSNVLDRTFPRGFEAEACTYESLARVERKATEPREREHVTLHYREHADSFETINIDSRAVFDQGEYRDRTEIRLTLDKPADYELLQRVHERPFDGFLPATAAIDEIDDYNLASVNDSVSQRRARRD